MTRRPQISTLKMTTDDSMRDTGSQPDMQPTTPAEGNPLSASDAASQAADPRQPADKVARELAAALVDDDLPDGAQEAWIDEVTEGVDDGYRVGASSVSMILSGKTRSILPRHRRKIDFLLKIDLLGITAAEADSADREYSPLALRVAALVDDNPLAHEMGELMLKTFKNRNDSKK